MNNLSDIFAEHKKSIVDFIDGVRKESYEQGRADRDKELAEHNVFFSNRPIEDIVLEACADERAKTIDECIKAINDLNIEYAYPHTICNILEMLKEQNNGG